MFEEKISEKKSAQKLCDKTTFDDGSIVAKFTNWAENLHIYWLNLLKV